MAELIPSPWNGLDAARADRDDGADKALGSDAISEWRRSAMGAIQALAESGRTFTVDAVIERAGLPKGEVGTNVNNAIGALFLHASKSGLIKTTGRRVATTRRSNHARRVAEWIGTGWTPATPSTTDGWSMARMLVSVLRSAPMDGTKSDIEEWWIEQVAPALDSYERTRKSPD